MSSAPTAATTASASVDPEGNFLPGGLSATDVVLHHFRDRFAAAPPLAAIFAGRIEVLNGPLPYDYQDFPRLQLYGDLTTEDERPTAKVIEGVQQPVVKVGSRRVASAAGQLQGSATQAMRDIVEERERSR